MSAVHSIGTDFLSADSGDMTRIYIDGIKSDTTLFTEVVAFDTVSASLVRLVENAALQTLRTARIASYDIDADGLLEIPSLTEIPGSSVKNELNLSVGSKSLVEWRKLEANGRFSVVRRTVISGS